MCQTDHIKLIVLIHAGLTVSNLPKGSYYKGTIWGKEMEARDTGFMTDSGPNEDDKSMYSQDAILVVCAILY